MRRQFQLTEEDEACLTARRLNWETVVETANNAKTKWLIVHAYPIPEGYNHGAASVALRIPPSYPDEQIDMAYFSPPLTLVSGAAIKQLTMTAIDGKAYQQWSRHRTAANPWRPGLDNACTHLLQTDTWLERALKG